MTKDTYVCRRTHSQVVQLVDELIADRSASGIQGLEALQVLMPEPASIAHSHHIDLG